MLPAAARLRRSTDFDRVVRAGRRVGGPALVVHYLQPGGAAGSDHTRVGFIIGRAVGSSVQRHRTSRQLRHLTRERLNRLAAGSQVVVRALPGAGRRTSAQLGADLDRALARLPTVGVAPATGADHGAVPPAAVQAR
ncbi:MAG: ribonuclease P protein component [Mycobacteriales bacterium]